MHGVNIYAHALYKAGDVFGKHVRTPRSANLPLGENKHASAGRYDLEHFAYGNSVRTKLLARYAAKGAEKRRKVFVVEKESRRERVNAVWVKGKKGKYEIEVGGMVADCQKRLFKLSRTVGGDKAEAEKGEQPQSKNGQHVKKPFRAFRGSFWSHEKTSFGVDGR
jgi:hypothetical protein